MFKSTRLRQTGAVSARLFLLVGLGLTTAGTASAQGAQTQHIALSAQPNGTVRLGRTAAGDVKVSISITGLTPSVEGDSSVHSLEVDSPQGAKVASLGVLTADAGGRVVATFDSGIPAGKLSNHDFVVLRLGRTTRVNDAPVNPVAAEAIATAPVRMAGRAVNFKPIEANTPDALGGTATFSYDATAHTLTVAIVHATGFAPNSAHAAHIHSGSCANQGAPIYMLTPDLIANGSGVIDATRTITGVTSFTPPTNGWYLNIHQGDSASILANGMPALSFRPLLCGDLGVPAMTSTPISKASQPSTTKTAGPAHW